MAEGLTEATRAAWAKSSGDRQTWLPLTQHLSDASDIARKLFDDWMPPVVQSEWGQCFPRGAEDARLAISWLAGLHDVGKASPAFAVQVDYLAEPMRRAGLEIGTRADLAERRFAPHAAVSNVHVRNWLIREHDWDRITANQFGSVLGAHHGKAADGLVLQAVQDRPRLVGEGRWNDVRDEIVAWMTSRTCVTDRLDAWSRLRLPEPVLVGMSALVIVADWIASSERYFSYRRVSDVDPPLTGGDQRDRVLDALAELAFPRPWTPPEPPQDAAPFYKARFSWDDTRAPSDVQKHVFDVARNRDLGMLIVETTTGTGKTEAALVAAEVLAARLGLSGLYFALPTQATGDAMFDRVVPWLEALPEPPQDVPAWSLTLAHGKAALNEHYRELVEAVDRFDRSRLGGVIPTAVHDGDDSDVGSSHRRQESSTTDAGPEAEFSNIAAHQWFRGRKRTLLASFSVGTIDQVLMAGLESKHLMLRHLGLMGKVVVIDEAHASDAYMDVYLDRVLQWLGAYQVPVVVLSATLPARRRQGMIAAYLGRRPVSEALGSALESVGSDERYPLITAVDRDLGRLTADEVPHRGETRTVTWEWCSTDLDDLMARLVEETVEGGCILIIRNTVRDAQETAAAAVRAGLGPVTLNHARFMAYDRGRKDAELRSLFGPVGDRPKRHIVVATQVAEQSLDVDFDLLITDLAPIDLIFQRIGRLHRHQRDGRPSSLQDPRCLLLIDASLAPSDGLPRASAGSRAVYGDHLLLRTAAVLVGTEGRLAVPGMVSPLVQRVFGEAPVGPPEAEAALVKARTKHLQELKSKRRRAKPFLLGPWDPTDDTQDLSTWTRFSVSDGSDRQGQAMVRDIEPTLEVIVVPTDPEGSTAIQPPWVTSDAPMDVRSVPDDATARLIAGWSVRFPPALTRSPQQLDDVIRWLQEEQPDVRRWEWHRHPLLRGELFLPMGQVEEGSYVLKATIISATGPWTLRYSPDNGLELVQDA